MLSSSLVVARASTLSMRRALELRLAMLALGLLLVGCSGGGGFGGGSTTAATPTPSPSGSSPPATQGTAVAYVNRLRSLGGLPALAENTALGQGLAAHALYMVKNDVIGHSEDLSLPFSSPEGDTAARNSNLAISSDLQQTDEASIDGWITGPFHAAGILDATLKSTMFSSYAEAKSGVRYGACLDVLHGRSGDTTASFPVLWPGDGTTVGLTAYAGNEAPDPLTGTPGFTAPSGLPIYCLLGTGAVTPVVNGSSLTTGGQPVTHAVFDESTYVNPDPDTQSLARAVLGSRDMVVIMPRQPLTRSATYQVSLAVNGQTISWSFAVAAGAK